VAVSLAPSPACEAPNRGVRLFEAAKRRAMSASSQPTSLSAARVGVLPSDDSQMRCYGKSRPVAEAKKIASGFTTAACLALRDRPMQDLGSSSSGQRFPSIAISTRYGRSAATAFAIASAMSSAFSTLTASTPMPAARCTKSSAGPARSIF
jgi:hypothetical protein